MLTQGQKNTLLVVGATIGVSAIVLVVVIMMVNKNKRQQEKVAEQSCKQRGGTWANGKCTMPAPTPAPAPAPAPEPTPAPAPDTGYGEPDLYIKKLAKEIYDNLESGWFGWNLNTYPETAEKILALNDAQISQLYTYYNKNHAKDYPTLTQLFDNEWDDWDGKYDLVVDRLQGLGLR
jgi:hypothetical protein